MSATILLPGSPALTPGRWLKKANGYTFISCPKCGRGGLLDPWYGTPRQGFKIETDGRVDPWFVCLATPVPPPAPPVDKASRMRCDFEGAIVLKGWSPS